MKRVRYSIALLAMICMVPAASHAQLGGLKKLKDKAADKIDRPSGNSNSNKSAETSQDRSDDSPAPEERKTASAAKEPAGQQSAGGDTKAEKANTTNSDPMDPTNGASAKKIRANEPGKYYYSALISQKVSDNYFLDNHDEDKIIVNAVKFTSDKNAIVTYYSFGTIDARLAGSFENKYLDEHRFKSVPIEPDKKMDDCYCDMWSVQVGFQGIVVEKDGSITVFRAPLKSDKNLDFDLDKLNVDVLTKDLAAAKAVKLDDRRKEALAYINKTVKKKDEKEAAGKVERIKEKRRTPVGMAGAIPEATIKSELKKMLESKPVYGTNMQRNTAECSYTVTSAYVIDRDWVVERNALGVILGRKIATEAVEKGSNGKCYLRRYAFYEQNQGGDKYGAPFIDHEIFWTHTEDDGEAICENLK